MERALLAEPGHPTALTALTLHAIESGNEDEARKRLTAARAQPRIAREQMQRFISAFREQFGRAP
jgi:hypothetical protein